MNPATLAILVHLAGIHFAEGEKAAALADVRRIVATMPQAELAEAVMVLAERFTAAIEATRTHVETLAVVEFGMFPEATDKLNLPTLVGSLMGLSLPEVREEACCATCAFRQGTAANQCLPTVGDALVCVGHAERFYCHEDAEDESKPLKVCRGWAQAVRLTKEPA